MNKKQITIKKSLFEAIKRADLEAVKDLITEIDWEVFYAKKSSIDGYTKEEEGFLYELFPIGGEEDIATYNRDFSQKCLRLFIKNGYDPSQDIDINIDFFTECNRRCFKDFCLELKRHSETLKKTFLSFLNVSYPWYDEHFEYLIDPCLGEIDNDGESVLEKVWLQFVGERGFASTAPFIVDSFIKTSQALEGHCLKTLKQKENFVKTMREQQDRFQVAYRYNHEKFKSLENYVTDLISRVEKSILSEKLSDKLQKNQSRDFARKM